jgi:hypothetical protein
MLFPSGVVLNLYRPHPHYINVKCIFLTTALRALGYGWGGGGERSPDMEDSCEHADYAIIDSRKYVVSSLAAGLD